MFNEVIKKTNWNGADLELSTGKIARQADGAVMLRMGDAAILCTVVSAKQAKEGMDFFPLTVNYQERSYAAGKIPGGFFKREGRGSEKEILVSLKKYNMSCKELSGFIFNNVSEKYSYCSNRYAYKYLKNN